MENLIIHKTFWLVGLEEYIHVLLEERKKSYTGKVKFIIFVENYIFFVNICAPVSGTNIRKAREQTENFLRIVKFLIIIVNLHPLCVRYITLTYPLRIQSNLAKSHKS